MRMNRGCPANGRATHRFDEATHRCVCGRWQAGFAPKKEPARPRDECQICEREQALDTAGCLGHHGYKRPGWGFLTGDCAGVGHAPFPDTDALEAYLVALHAYVARQRDALTALLSSDTLPYQLARWDFYGKKLPTAECVVSRGDGKTRELPGFDDLMRLRAALLQDDIKSAQADGKRVEARIAKGRGLRQ